VQKTDEKTDPAQMANDFVKMIKYTAGGYDDDAGFQKLDALVGDWEQQIAPQGPNRRLFYMALPPSVYPLVAKMVRKHCMAKGEEGTTCVAVRAAPCYSLILYLPSPLRVVVLVGTLPNEAATSVVPAKKYTNFKVLLRHFSTPCPDDKSAFGGSPSDDAVSCRPRH
jgi:hypothetical protein